MVPWRRRDATAASTFSCARLITATSAPCAANASAIARLMPLVPPATNTACRSKLRADMRSLPSHSLQPVQFAGSIRLGMQRAPTELIVMSCWRVVAVVLLASLAAMPARAQEKPGITKVRLAVGGKPALFYLPLTIVERLGLFRQQGLDVEISDFAGGARALQAVIGGRAGVVTGSIEHSFQIR